MDCNKMHTLMEENNDKKSIFTAKDNDKQDRSYAVKNRGIGERERRTTTFTERFCGGCER